MLQSKVPEHLVLSIAKGAVQSGRKFNCEAPPCELKDPTSRNEVLHAEVACMTFGMKLNREPEHLGHSIAKGAVES